MRTHAPRVDQRVLHTEAGRGVAVTRFGPGTLGPGGARLVLDTACLPYDRAELWLVLTPAEGRRLAEMLAAQADLAEREESP